MDSWKEMDNIALEISCLEIMYDGLNKETKGIITFPQYATYRNWGVMQEHLSTSASQPASHVSAHAFKG
jgi:hypothetical protein